MLRRVGILGILAGLLLLTGCGREKFPVVRVNAGSLSGSGVIYEKTEACLVVVTAGHVVETAVDLGKQVDIIFPDGYSAEAGNCLLSETSETAFVEIPLEEIPKKRQKGYQPAARNKERFDALESNDRMVLVGAASSGNPAEGQQSPGVLLQPWIFVEDFGQYMILVEGQSTPGMSGGGLFDKSGNLMGILCGVNEEGVSAAVPLSVIMAEYALQY